MNGADPKTTEKKGTQDVVLSEEEYEKAKLTDMLHLSAGLEESEVILSVQKKMDSETNILKAEIKADGRRVSESKLERVVEAEEKSTQLLNKLGEKFSDINDTISDSEEVSQRKDKEDENDKKAEQEQNENIDSF